VDDTDDVGVFLGPDVGESTHHGHRLAPAGTKAFDKLLPGSETMLRALFDELTAGFGTALVIVDQSASIGALPLTVARSRSPGTRAARPPTCRAWPCGGSPTRIRARRGPTRRTPR